MAASIFAKMGMPEERDGVEILKGHRRALTDLLGGLAPDHIARGTVAERIKEVEQAIKDERAAQKGRGR